MPPGPSRTPAWTGKINTIGWNVSYGQLDAIDEGIQVAALDQKWSEQAGFGALACADFLKNGIVRPNTQELFPVTKANSAEARAALDAVLGATRQHGSLTRVQPTHRT